MHDSTLFRSADAALASTKCPLSPASGFAQRFRHEGQAASFEEQARDERANRHINQGRHPRGSVQKLSHTTPNGYNTRINYVTRENRLATERGTAKALPARPVEFGRVNALWPSVCNSIRSTSTEESNGTKRSEIRTAQTKVPIGTECYGTAAGTIAEPEHGRR